MKTLPKLQYLKNFNQKNKRTIFWLNMTLIISYQIVNNDIIPINEIFSTLKINPRFSIHFWLNFVT